MQIHASHLGFADDVAEILETMVLSLEIMDGESHQFGAEFN